MSAHVTLSSNDELWVRNSEVNISKSDNTVYATFTCQGAYWDASPVVKCLNSDPGTLTIKYESPVDENAIRTVTFVNAKCVSYSETFEYHTADSKIFSIWLTFSIEAEAVSLGEEDFPK
jgi:hypothetical protein